MQSYIKLFFSFSEDTSALTDAEIGRIIRQMLAYAESGDTDSILEGNERFLFPVYKSQIDRDVERYSAVSEQRAANGRAGGKKRAKASAERKADVCLTSEANASKSSKCFSNEANQANAYFANQIKQNRQEEEKEKDEEEDKEKELSITSSTTVAAVIQGARAHDDGDGDTIEAYASNNLQVLSPGNMEDLQSFTQDLPEDVIRYAIDTACANGIRKWAYVRAILSAWREQGIRTIGEAKADSESKHTPRSRDKPRENPALNYAQRSYNESDYAGLFVDLGGGTAT